MIYLDNAATTKPDKNALARADEFLNEEYFNPSSLYNGGLNCAKEIKSAKEHILKSLGAIDTNFEVIFTSCGSESNNQAIFCATKRGAFVTDMGEHSAVHNCFMELKNRGTEVEFATLNEDGSVNLESLFQIVKNNLRVSFVSIMHVNNETGAINDVNYIAQKIKEINPKIIFHVDGVQSYGKIPFKISSKIDLYSISAHKINALKGTGALIKRKSLSLSPLIFGGGQENGLRSGTENVYGIKVFHYASENHYAKLNENFKKVKTIKEYFIDNLDKTIFKIISSENSSPYILTVSAVGLRGEVLMHILERDNIYVGNGSACSSKHRYSRVISACGFDNMVLDGVVRISFGVENTMEEAISVVEIINKRANELKVIMK